MDLCAAAMPAKRAQAETFGLLLVQGAFSLEKGNPPIWLADLQLG
jgi:hypothetical protein